VWGVLSLVAACSTVGPARSGPGPRISPGDLEDSGGRPVVADIVQATEGSDLLADGIGGLGDGDPARALLRLQQLLLGSGRLGHDAAASYYAGRALEQLGLGALATTQFSRALSTGTSPWAARARRRLLDLERRSPGLIRLAPPRVNGALRPPLPSELRARLLLDRARLLRREERTDEAGQIERGLPHGTTAAWRAGRQAAARLVVEEGPAHTERALEKLQDLLRWPEAPGTERDRTLLAAAQLAYGLGRAELGLELLRQVEPGSPWHEAATTAGAWSLLYQGRRGDALRALEPLQSRAPAEVPVGALLLATRTYLDVCRADLAEPLLWAVERRLDSDEEVVEMLHEVHEEDAVLLPHLAGVEGRDAVGLLLQADEGWLLPLWRTLARSLERVESGRVGVPDRPRYRYLVALIAKRLRGLRERLQALVEPGLLRRAGQTRRELNEWYQLLLSLRIGYFELRKWEILLAVHEGREPDAPQPPRWADPPVDPGAWLHLGLAGVVEAGRDCWAEPKAGAPTRTRPP